MPESSELFTNVYVKGYGVEVIFISLVDTHSHTLFYSLITVGLNEAYRFFQLLLVETAAFGWVSNDYQYSCDYMLTTVDNC